MAAALYCSLKPRYSTYSTYSRVRVRVAGEKRGDRKRKRAGWLLDGLESRPTEGGEHIPSLAGMCAVLVHSVTAVVDAKGIASTATLEIDD